MAWGQKDAPSSTNIMHSSRNHKLSFIPFNWMLKLSNYGWTAGLGNNWVYKIVTKPALDDACLNVTHTGRTLLFLKKVIGKDICWSSHAHLMVWSRYLFGDEEVDRNLVTWHAHIGSPCLPLEVTVRNRKGPHAGELLHMISADLAQWWQCIHKP